MRLFILFALSLLASCATDLAVPVGGIMASGKLIAFQPANIACGGITIASTGTYKILSGPANLVGKEVHVLIPCADTPRLKWSPGAGDLDSFVVGDTHFLRLTREIEDGLDFPEQVAKGWLYVRAASATPLRPNNSFKPKPLRGSA